MVRPGQAAALRDGKAIARPAEHGEGSDRKRYAITEAGIADVKTWLAEPAPPEPHLQTVLFAKVVLALMLSRPADRSLPESPAGGAPAADA